MIRNILLGCFLVLFVSIDILAQSDPCKSSDYLLFRDVPRAELLGSKRKRKKNAEKACERHRLEQRGNWKLAKELIYVDESSELYLDGRKLGISDGDLIRGGVGKGFLIGLLVSGVSTQLSFSSENRTAMAVSPLSSMLFAGLLSRSAGQIPAGQMEALAGYQPTFLVGYKSGFSKAANSNYRVGAIAGSLVSSLLVTAGGFVLYGISEGLDY